MKKSCSHCHLEYDESALFSAEINGKEEFFCCKGCEGVFRILSDLELGSFYEKLGKSTLTPPSVESIESSDLERFDSSVFMDKYAKKLDSNLVEISLILERIHCVACIWLNQKILNNTDGILKVDINYTNNKAKILYDSRKIKLSEIIQKIRSIGYDAQAYDPRILENINAKVRKEYYTRLIVGIFCTMNIMWIAVAQYLGYFLGMDSDVKNILNAASFILATPTLFYSGWIFFRGGYFGVKNGFINMDLLVSFGASLTYFYSIYAALTQKGETYFESVTMIITFVLIGKFLEIRSKKSAGDSIDKIASEIPSTINIKVGDKIASIAPENAKIGDIISVAPGEKIVIDGVLLSEKTLLDSSMLTGESAFVEKKSGEALISGSINMDYSILYRATKEFSTSMMSNIINLIQDSISKKPQIQNKANAISYYFSGFVIFVAFATFIAWCVLGIQNGAEFAQSVEKAIIVAVSVIIISCPCALALATPIAVIVGISEAYKHKLLFKEARFLETFAKTNMIVFDKTGTLTYGKPKVVNAEILEHFDFRILASFLRLNNHPISQGVLEFVESKIAESKKSVDSKSSESSAESIEFVESKKSNIILSDFKQIAQKGIIAKCGDSSLLGGSKKFLIESGINCGSAQDSTIAQDSNMDFYFALDGKLCAIFKLQDTLKSDAKDCIKYFKDNKMRIVILSGDRKEVVQNVAQTLGISEYYCEQSPIDKSDFINKAHENGYINVFVGDGINDAIALNKSDISIAMGRGSDVAIESSDIILLDESLKSLVLSHKLAKKTYNVIKQNIKISIIYNFITIPLACLGFIIPLFAALSMSISSLIVTLNSLKLKRLNLK